MSEAAGISRTYRRIMFVIAPYMDAVKTLGGSPTSEEVFFPPLQFGSMGTVLRQEGYEVLVVTKPHGPWDDVAAALESFRPDVVGLSCYTYTYKSNLDAARLVKYLLPETLVVFGGHHICYENDTRILASHSEVDILVVGEGEVTVVEMMNRLNQGQGLRGVNGVTFREGSEIVRNGPRTFVKSLTVFPRIDYTLMDMSKIPSYYDRPPSEYIYFGKRFDIPKFARAFPLVISRGCVGKCKFCSAPRAYKSFRTRDPEQVLDEMEHLYEHYGLDYFHISSPTFPQHPKKDKQLLQGILDRGLKIRWSSQTRGDWLDEEFMDLMRQSGCMNINFGVETGSSELIEILGKRRDVGKLKRTMIQCAQRGIPVAASFLHNFPGARREDYLQTLDFIWDIAGYGCLAHGHRMWVEINTDIYDMAVAQGRLIGPDYWETPLLRSPRFNAPTMEELRSFVNFILFMRIAFHYRQIGRYLDGRELAVYEAGDKWRGRFLVELLLTVRKQGPLLVYASREFEEYLRQTLLPAELARLDLRHTAQVACDGLVGKVLVADASEAGILLGLLAQRGPDATLVLRSKDYPRGGLNPRGEDIEKGVWDYETDDLIDIQLPDLGRAMSGLQPKTVGLLVGARRGLVEAVEEVRRVFPGARVRLVSPRRFLAVVAQDTGLRGSVALVIEDEEFPARTLPAEAAGLLSKEGFDLLVVHSEARRHRDLRREFAFCQMNLGGVPVLGHSTDAQWFVLGWPPIDDTWFHYRLRA